MPRQRTRLTVPQPFDLRLCLTGHGWYALAPHRYDPDRVRFDTVLRIARLVVDATVTADANGLVLTLDARRRLDRSELAEARRQIAHMLRLDDDLSPFHELCRQHRQLAWVAARGGGRLLRSPTVFEDLMKLLFTTNTSWAATEAMTRNLVEALGSRAPSGARAFPTPRQCVRDRAFYRDTVRCGYRADAAIGLARAFADGELCDEDFLCTPSADELWQRLTALRGFGPYAAGQAMRLCGHYQHLALDSWCRQRLAALVGNGKQPSDRSVERRYRAFAPFQGLALWCELTADWHLPRGTEAE